MGCCCSDDALWSTEHASPSYDSAEIKRQRGAGEGCIFLSAARLCLICGALPPVVFQGEMHSWVHKQFSSDLLEQVTRSANTEQVRLCPVSAPVLQTEGMPDLHL